MFSSPAEEEKEEEAAQLPKSVDRNANLASLIFSSHSSSHSCNFTRVAFTDGAPLELSFWNNKEEESMRRVVVFKSTI